MQRRREIGTITCKYFLSIGSTNTQENSEEGSESLKEKRAFLNIAGQLIYELTGTITARTRTYSPKTDGVSGLKGKVETSSYP